MDDFESKSEGLTNKSFEYTDYEIGQYVQGVLDFSSQYGSDYSISYTAANIIGKPTKFPEYGDFAETFAMRTYGNWWTQAPSHVTEIQSQNFTKIPVHDFIVVYFEDYILPKRICILETFNPGAVVRIWAYTISKTWFCLWEAKDYNTLSKMELKKARNFSPPLKKLQFPTKTLKLEFNHTYLNYFTEIDAILLCGYNVKMENTKQMHDFYEHHSTRGCISKKLQEMRFRPNIGGNFHNTLKDFLLHDLDKFILLENSNVDVECEEDNKHVAFYSKSRKSLDVMPIEILVKIFGYLDLESLFRIGRVSRNFYHVSKNALLYSEINLKPYWNLVDTNFLTTLAGRAILLKKLDMSWCGLHGTITSTEFKTFIQQRGDNLTHLRLSSCKFLNASCIETIGIVCDNLRELILRNCVTDPPIVNFSCLANLKNLERLDMYQTVFEQDLLLTMLENNRQLKHLNLAFSGITINMDTVAMCISINNPILISLDIWKSHFLTINGLNALSECHNLEELDLGWCLRDVSIGDSLRRLITKCPNLKKLFLATVRGMTDQDVVCIANHCHNLEQLDLMGVLGISKERYVECVSNMLFIYYYILFYLNNHTICCMSLTIFFAVFS